MVGVLPLLLETTVLLLPSSMAPLPLLAPRRKPSSEAADPFTLLPLLLPPQPSTLSSSSLASSESSRHSWRVGAEVCLSRPDRRNLRLCR